VVLGGFFIVLVQNGMNLAQISSYMQMVLLGALLILAVIFDQLRYRMIMSGSCHAPGRDAVNRPRPGSDLPPSETGPNRAQSGKDPA
jgi:hypothetical protein